MEIKISVTDIPPMMGYLKDMSILIGYLHFKSNLTATEKKMMASYEDFIATLENEPDEDFMKPLLKLVKG